MNDEARMTSDLARPNVSVPSVAAAAGLRHSRAPFFPKGVRVIRLNPTESDRSIFGTGVLPPAARAVKLNQIKGNQGMGWGTSGIRLRQGHGATGRPSRRKTTINSE